MPSGRGFVGGQGYQSDADSGLLHVGARYYDPDAGRFTTADTYLGEVTDPQSLNRYNYCEGDPVNCLDPSGHRGNRFKKWLGVWQIAIGTFAESAAGYASWLVSVGAIVTAPEWVPIAIVIGGVLIIGGTFMWAAADDPGAPSLVSTVQWPAPDTSKWQNFLSTPRPR